MSPMIFDGPKGPYGDENVVEAAVKFFKKIGNAIKTLLTPPKDKETPEDVAERNRAFQALCDQINDEANQVEAYVIQQLEGYGSYLSALNDSEAYPLLQEYRVNTRMLLQQLDFLKMQIPGIISAEVARRLSDTDAECLKIRRMLPGAEKEVKMREFVRTVINGALEKCAQTTSSIIGQVRDIFIERLQECIDTSRRHLEQTEAELTEITGSAGDAAERERIYAQAHHVAECCELVLRILV